MACFSSNNKYRSKSEEDTRAEKQVTQRHGCLCVLAATSLITNTGQDKLLKCTEYVDHRFWNDQNKANINTHKKKTTMTIYRAQFPGKVQTIFHIDSIMALNSLPAGNHQRVCDETSVADRNTWNVRHSDPSAVRCVCLNIYSSLANWMTCTAARGAQGVLSPTPSDSTFSFK